MSEPRSFTLEALNPQPTEAEPVYVEDYPYGRTLRTTIRYWREWRKGHGYRFVSQTMNPKTGRWNKPKRSTYHVLIVVGRHPDTGHIRYEDLRSGGWDKLPTVEAFEAKYGHTFGDHERKVVEYVKATIRVNDAVEWKVVTGEEAKNAPTMEEQAQQMRRLVVAEMRRPGVLGGGK